MKVNEPMPSQQPGVMWSPAKQIKMLKEALKKDYLYSDDELKKLKSRLRDMYIVNKQLKRGNGFGRAS
jgi:hypothetical protein